MSTSALPSDAKTRTLVQEAAEWRLLALLFECPRNGWQGHVAVLASEITDPDLLAAARAAQAEATEGLYHSVFGPGGPASAREVSYHDSIQLGYLMSELNNYFAAFSYHPVTQEPTDHVSVEAGFISYLRLKEAYALASSDAEPAAIAGEAAQRFMEDHLSAVAEPLVAALESCGPRYLVLAGRALLRRVGPRRTTQAGELRVAHSPAADPSSEDDLFGCGESEGRE